MAANEGFEDAENLYLAVPAYVVSGSPVIVGMIPGVALTTRDSAGKAQVRTAGAYRVLVGTGAVTVGMPIYITAATGALVIAPGATIQLFGHALEAKSSGAATILVRLAQFAVASDVPA